jgi:hypothetical protein
VVLGPTGDVLERGLHLEDLREGGVFGVRQEPFGERDAPRRSTGEALRQLSASASAGTTAATSPAASASRAPR